MKIYRLSYKSKDDFVYNKWFSSYTLARAHKKIIKLDGYTPIDVEQFETGKGREGLLNFLNELESNKV